MSRAGPRSRRADRERGLSRSGRPSPPTAPAQDPEAIAPAQAVTAWANGVRDDGEGVRRRIAAQRAELADAVRKAQAEYLEAALKVGRLTLISAAFESQAAVIETSIHDGLADLETALQAHELSTSTKLGIMQ
jgi:hypothetical protein